MSRTEPSVFGADSCCSSRLFVIDTVPSVRSTSLTRNRRGDSVEPLNLRELVGFAAFSEMPPRVSTTVRFPWDHFLRRVVSGACGRGYAEGRLKLLAEVGTSACACVPRG